MSETCAEIATLTASHVAPWKSCGCVDMMSRAPAKKLRAREEPEVRSARGQVTAVAEAVTDLIAADDLHEVLERHACDEETPRRMCPFS